MTLQKTKLQKKISHNFERSLDQINWQMIIILGMITPGLLTIDSLCNHSHMIWQLTAAPSKLLLNCILFRTEHHKCPNLFQIFHIYNLKLFSATLTQFTDTWQIAPPKKHDCNLSTSNTSAFGRINRSLVHLPSSIFPL